MYALDIPLIHQAIDFLKGRIRKTPLEFSQPLSDVLHVPVYLKLECLQLTGSFKIRGALFYLSTLSLEEKSKGVAACSAGNHGIGVAYAAKELGIPCTIYLPSHTDQTKLRKIAQLGATIKQSQWQGYDETLKWAEEDAKKHQYHLISAFDDARIMAANGGSLAAEIDDDLSEVGNILVPVGGGGLSAGIAYYYKTKRPVTRLIGCQHRESCAFKLSLEQGRAITQLPAIDTIASGIEGGIGAKCFEILQSRIDDVMLVTEEEIVNGFTWMLSNHQYLVEPTSACVLSPSLLSRIHPNGPLVIVVTGRNVSDTTIKKLIQ